ncbi:MAG: pilus assembly protein TadG-related protein [Acidimicrobiia bacterium]|nr:pilus assembly protein TadG-related protein [Acidimicrobiia bacterium]
MRVYREDGAVLVTVTFSLVALLLISALAVDIGMVMVARRAAQNSADHSALSAAWADCHGSDPTTAAQTAAVRNGHTAADLTLTEPTSGEWNAEVSDDVSLSFAQVLGVGTLTVKADAAAACTGASSASTSIFALGDTCSTWGKDQIDISGSNQMIYGGVHSNDGIRVGGSDNDFGPSNPPVDKVTYVSYFNNGGGGNTFDPTYPQSIGNQPSPVNFALADYQPGSANALAAGSEYYFRNGEIDGSYIESRGDGLYYSRDNIKLDKEITANVTLVAEGVIEVSASNQNLNPYVDGLLAFGGHVYSGDEQCDKFVVSMGGSTNDWTGIIYGPHGLIEMNGSDNTTVTGSLVGFSVRLNGSNISIDSGGTGLPPDYKVQLLR